MSSYIVDCGTCTAKGRIDRQIESNLENCDASNRDRPNITMKSVEPTQKEIEQIEMLDGDCMCVRATAR